MLTLYLTSTTEVIEVAVAAGLVTAAMGVFIAIPFFFQFFVDDQRDSEE